MKVVTTVKRLVELCDKSAHIGEEDSWENVRRMLYPFWKELGEVCRYQSLLSLLPHATDGGYHGISPLVKDAYKVITALYLRQEKSRAAMIMTDEEKAMKMYWRDIHIGNLQSTSMIIRSIAKDAEVITDRK